MPRHLAPTAIVLTASLLSVAGCAPINNDRLTVGGHNLTPSLSPPPVPHETVASDSSPSLTTIDRSDWEPTHFLVPVEVVEHHPHYTELEPRYARATPRQRDEFPTTDSAFDLGADPGAQVWEMLSGPFWGAFDVVAFIPRAVIEPPGSVVTSPRPGEVDHVRTDKQ
ncbi:MAG TPA: hypothetical protein VG797_09400 [Phycisphaerales bacterium]|nr:hypothetical protein [Phycisphaerales bacterium]